MSFYDRLRLLIEANGSRAIEEFRKVAAAAERDAEELEGEDD